MSNLISKYNISEQDLYALSIIEDKKSRAGFSFQEKLKGKAMGILKPYNVKFMDIGKLLSEIKNEKFHTNQLLIEKYGQVDLEGIKSSMGLKKYVIPICFFIVVVVLFNLFSKKVVDPCDCADIGAKVQIIGYQNLTSEQKKLYDACEKKYTTPAAAFEACVESQMPKK